MVQEPIACCMAFGWGFGMGWKMTTDGALAPTSTPKGQAAELVGIFIVVSQAQSCLPSPPHYLYGYTRDARESEDQCRVRCCILCHCNGVL